MLTSLKIINALCIDYGIYFGMQVREGQMNRIICRLLLVFFSFFTTAQLRIGEKKAAGVREWSMAPDRKQT